MLGTLNVVGNTKSSDEQRQLSPPCTPSKGSPMENADEAAMKRKFAGQRHHRWSSRACAACGSHRPIVCPAHYGLAHIKTIPKFVAGDSTAVSSVVTRLNLMTLRLSPAPHGSSTSAQPDRLWLASSLPVRGGLQRRIGLLPEKVRAPHCPGETARFGAYVVLAVCRFRWEPKAGRHGNRYNSAIPGRPRPSG